MSSAKPTRRLRIDEALFLRLENKLKETGRRQDISPFIEEICDLFLSDRMIHLSGDMISRLKVVREELKRKDELSQFVEWICELFIDESSGKYNRDEDQPEEVKAFKLKDKNRDQRKFGT